MSTEKLTISSAKDYRRYNGNRSNVHVLQGYRTRILVAVLFALLLAGCGNSKPFDSAVWLKSDPRERGRMADDLVKRKRLVGQTIAEVERVLGPPDQNYVAAVRYQIDLGWAFKDPKHYGLIVDLDENRKVREVRIVD